HGRRRCRPRTARPGVEWLECRLVPSTLVVRNNFDSGTGSLRDAIATAANGDTIVFADRLDRQTIKLTSGELAISKSLMISGPGAEALTVSGNHASRVFDISSGVKVSISGLTIADGSQTRGGGIDNAGALTLSHDIITNNAANGGMGGGGL